MPSFRDVAVSTSRETRKETFTTISPPPHYAQSLLRTAHRYALAQRTTSDRRDGKSPLRTRVH